MSEHSLLCAAKATTSVVSAPSGHDPIDIEGVYTTLRFQHRTPINLDAHLDRLFEDASQAGLQCPQRQTILEQISARIEKFCSLVETTEGVLRLAVVHSIAGRGGDEGDSKDHHNTKLVINARERVDWPEQLSVRVCSERLVRNALLAGIKQLNRLELIRASQQLKQYQSDCHEGIVLDTEGFVIEGLISNIFWFKNNVFHTPSVDFAGVNGLTRRAIIKTLGPSHYVLNIGEFNLQQLLDAEHIWLCNSVRGLKAVSRLNQQVYCINPDLNNLLNKALCDD